MRIIDSKGTPADVYKKAKEHFDLPEPKDPNIVIDNGKITQIIKIVKWIRYLIKSKL